MQAIIKNLIQMKKITAFIILSQMVFNLGIAQNKNVVSAYNYLKYGELDKAKEAIDAASLHEQTSLMSKNFETEILNN